MKRSWWLTTIEYVLYGFAFILIHVTVRTILAALACSLAGLLIGMEHE